MIRNTKQPFKLTALAAALVSVCGTGPVLAQSNEGSVSVGIGNWSNDRRHSGVYDGMQDDGGYGLFDADLLKRDATTGTSLGLKARNLGLDNREILLEWMRQGNIGASIEYSRIVRDQEFIYNTGLQGIGTTTLRVPTPSIVPGTGVNWELGTQRDRVTAKFFKNLMPGLTFNASYRHETKEGTRPWSRGGAAEFAVEPIDSTIQIAEAALNYSQGALQLSGGYYGTFYENANSMVTTTLTNLATPFFLSLPLSNQAHEIFVNGGYNFTPTTRGTFKLSYSRATQDEALGNFGGTSSPLAPTSLDGRIDTTLVEAGVSARPMPRLSVVANLRYRDFSDKTPIFGVVFPGPTVFNTPFSYTNTVGKLEANYQLPQAFSLLGGIEYNTQDRQVPNVGTLWVPFRASLDEMTYRIQLRKSMSETVNGSLAYLRGDRDGSSYKVPGVGADPERDRTNPLNIADRKRDKWRAMVDWSPAERLGLQFVIEDARDDYGGPNLYGLQEGTGRLYAVDASDQVNSAWQVLAFYSRDENKASEITERLAGTTKFSDLSEVGDSFGAGVKGTVSAKVKVGGNVEQFRSVNKYNQFRVGPTGYNADQVPASPPDITNTLLRLKLYADYAVRKNADVRFNVIHERWSTDDWSWYMFPATGRTPWAMGTGTDGTTVLSNPKETSTFFGVRYVYKFQ
jgi:MtrB/PioB family decaheme-associated outer membrane protein